MNLVVVNELRFARTPDGCVWTRAMFPYAYWRRYLETFDGVRVVARARQTAAVGNDWKPASGARVSFAVVPHYVGPWEYLRAARSVRRAVRAAVAPGDAVLLRVSSQLASCLEPKLRRSGHPYGLEVVGDPTDLFARGASRHPLRAFFSWWFVRGLRRQCAGAAAIAYVTERALQARFPPPAGAHACALSDVELPGSAFRQDARPVVREGRPKRLVMVGSLEQMYKAPDVVLEATAACIREGIDLALVIVGGGKHRGELEDRARALGVSERVVFTGELSSGEPVRARLDEADLFVLPSRSEGLPRAMLEAMARGLPCIGSTAGGIPELLAPEDLVAPGDPAALARKIASVLGDPERMARMSRTNLERARSYREEALRERRLRFLEALRERTADWIARGSPSAGGTPRREPAVLPGKAD